VEEEDHRQAGGPVGLEKPVDVLLEGWIVARSQRGVALNESWISTTSSAERSMGTSRWDMDGLLAMENREEGLPRSISS
jgi:hypothetical protein